jgi:glycosyltransferase involved in cell wall biosynthesis
VNSPEVTIAIPTYNREALLPRAIGSALSQTYRDIEVVVCDDGSMDGTQALLAGYRDERLRVIAQPENRGMFVNMNTCLSSARGKFFLMLSDDDYLEPNCVESLIAPWKRDDGLSMAYGQWWYHRAGRRELQLSAGPEIEDGWSYIQGYWNGKRPTILHGVLFKTQDIVRTGGIPEGYAQDTMMTLRIAFEGRVAHVARPVTNYCLQPESNTNRIALYTRIRDMDALLEMCLRVGVQKGVPEEALLRLERAVRRKISSGAAIGIVSLVGKGHPRIEVLQEAYRLRGFLGHRIGLGAVAVLGAALLPRSAVNALRRARRKYEGLPTDDAALGLKREIGF